MLLVPAAVVVAAAVSGVAAVTGPSQSQSTACASTTVDLTSGSGDSNSVDIVVLVNGSSSTSISQQVVQSNERSRVNIDVDYGDESVTISGETAENGSLVLDVTRDGTVLHESIVVNGSDDQLVFHIDQNGDVHVDRNRKSDECLCSPDDLEANVDADGVDVQINEDENEGFDVEVNVGSDGSDDDDDNYVTDGGRDIDCSESTSCSCSDSATEISPPVRQSSDSVGSGVTVMQVVFRPDDFPGLAMPDRSVHCEDPAAEEIIDCPPEREYPDG